MHEDAEPRVARNQALFRETNEAIESGQWRGEPSKALRFRCECSRMDCGEAVEVTLADYEHVRKFPRRFIVLDCHVDTSLEDIVARAEPYLVVERRGAGGEVAEASDPRG
ncbi:MAG TPA: hypothetical protein VE127_12465 [Solirubrobacteraceae bacterium]|jgi:hypothetical protein|nr:hypothetical protein [Solirubrobacteraceae bacterium]